MERNLDGFCIRLVEKGRVGNASPGRVALEFVDYFDLSTYPHLMELHQVLREAGVRELTAQSLPSGLRGLHFSYGPDGGDPTILYEQEQWTGAQEHTILHETYEIIQERLARLVPGYHVPEKNALCREADRFAAAVLMQEGVFVPYLLETGFDLLAVRHQFYRSYASVIYRARELLGDHLDFLIALYDRVAEGSPNTWPWEVSAEDFVVRHLVRTPGIRLTRPRAVFRPFRYPGHVFPRRGGPVLPGSAAEYVVRTGRPLLVERVRGFDFWGYNDLVALARPVRWYGRLAKILLLVLRYDDRHLLDAQVDAVAPDVRRQAYQII